MATAQNEYYQRNKKKILEKAKQTYTVKREEKIKIVKIYNKLNSNKIKESKLKYRQTNKDKIKLSNEKYYIKTKNTHKQVCNEYKSKRRLNDPLFKLTENIANLIRISLKNNRFTKSSRTHEILGCSYSELKLHLESKFESWMNWDNRGLYNGELNYGWDIDHIIPLSSAKTEDELIKLCHYSNLQPLCGYINRVIKRNNF